MPGLRRPLALATLMHDAMDDTYRLGGRPDPAAMHARFLGWLSPTRPHRTEQHRTEQHRTERQSP